MAYNKTNWQNLPNTTTPIIATNLNNMENGIEKSDKTLGIADYDSTATYSAGDYCIYNNTLYKANQDILTAEAWTSAHWTATDIEGELGTLDAKIDTEVGIIDGKIGGDEYDSTATYEIGDFCIYNNKLYRCTTAISAAEAFTPAHWEETSVEEELDALRKSGGIPTNSVIGYNGSTIPSGYEEVTPKTIITARPGTDSTYTATANYQTKIIHLVADITKGTNITINNDGCFLIGAGVTNVLVSFTGDYYYAVENQVYGIMIRRNRGGTLKEYAREIQIMSKSQSWFSVSPAMIDVEEGDVIQVLLYIDASGKSIGIRGTSYATIEEL